MAGLPGRNDYSVDITPEDDGKEVLVGGWVEDVRNLGGIAFIRLRRGTGWLQVTVIKKMDKDMFKEITSVTRESVISVNGVVQASDQAKLGFEVLARGFTLISAAETPLPLGVADMVESDLDTRLDNRFLDLRSGDPAWIFRVKAAVIQGMRRSLIDDGFVEITTPKIVATATEGGTELFRVDYFGRDAYLNQSPQLYKQILMASGLDRVFEFGPAFRAETHDTTRHINEFLSVDVEMSFATDSDAMDVLEAALVGGIESANTVDPDRQIEAPGTFERITYDRAIEVIADGGTEVPWGEDLGSDALRILADTYPGYYFIVNWPLESKPFYVQPDGKYGLGFDLMKGHIELASGAQRVHDHDLLVERLVALGLDPDGFGFYLNAFRYGMPPHAGWGLGLERVIQVLVGAENVREGILFPRDMKRLEP